MLLKLIYCWAANVFMPIFTMLHTHVRYADIIVTLVFYYPGNVFIYIFSMLHTQVWYVVMIWLWYFVVHEWYNVAISEFVLIGSIINNYIDQWFSDYFFCSFWFMSPISWTRKYYQVYHESSNDNSSNSQFNHKIMTSPEKLSLSIDVSFSNSSIPIIVFFYPIITHKNIHQNITHRLQILKE